VLRTLLKIDKTEGENKNAAQGAEKINAPDSLKALFAKDLSVAAANHDGKAAGAMVDAGIVKNADAFMAGSDVRGLTTSKTLEESVVGQLSDKVQIAVKTGVTEIRLLLRPESLGEMRVKLTLDGDVVMGKIYVENQQVKHIIENNMQSLKDSLAQHNLQTGAFDVDVGGGERDQTRDMADMARANIQEGSGERRAAPNPQPTDDLSMGRETGRRYGSNTIEFFA
jgi:flagellar hook-length control protein FliK